MAATILLVEDNPITSKLVRFTLEAQQLGVAVAGDGAAAMRAFGEHAVALVLVDLVLPDMDGFALLEASHDLDPTRPVILMTAFSAIDTAMRAFEVGAYQYLMKPFRLDALAKVLEKALQSRPD